MATYSNTDAVLDPADAERNEAFRKKGNEMIAGQVQISNEPTVARAVANAEGLVSHYPLSAVLVVFGVGLAVGVALGSILGGPHTPRPSFGQRTELVGPVPVAAASGFAVTDEINVQARASASAISFRSCS